MQFEAPDGLNLPASQTEHSCFVGDPLNLLYLPAVQLVHFEAPSCVLNWPATHLEQFEACLAPIKELNLPALQMLQNCLPSVSLYFPATQKVHAIVSLLVELLVRYLPAEHGVQLPALCPEYAPVLQMVQLFPPLKMYFPAEQAMQATLSSPLELSMRDFPAGQKVQLAEPIPEYLLVAQREQVSDPGVLYSPAPQLWQVEFEVAPLELLNLPPSQSTQALGRLE
mmetsp:Transcript_6412/g.12676  ORF Transcript_6412/g.12676 Transcript_6412/m.12676 type:complete len:225 (-) Transcript_6412:612-1286(-)